MTVISISAKLVVCLYLCAASSGFGPRFVDTSDVIKPKPSVSRLLSIDQMHKSLVAYLLNSERRNATNLSSLKELSQLKGNSSSFIEAIDELEEKTLKNIKALEKGVLPKPPWYISPTLPRSLFRK